MQSSCTLGAIPEMASTLAPTARGAISTTLQREHLQNDLIGRNKMAGEAIHYPRHSASARTAIGRAGKSGADAPFPRVPDRRYARLAKVTGVGELSHAGIKTSCVSSRELSRVEFGSENTADNQK